MCQLRGRLKRGPRTGDLVAIGDRVRITVQEDGSGMIEEVEERKQAIVRLDPRPQGEYQQILLANADQANFDGDTLGDICDPDDDNDQMPDDWETLYGLNPLDASDATGDLDGDGILNLDEYLGGTNPKVADMIDAEIPLLPPWGILVLAGLLIRVGSAVKTSGRM